MSDVRVAVVTAGGSGMGARCRPQTRRRRLRRRRPLCLRKGEALADEFGGLGVTGSNRSPDDLKLVTGPSPVGGASMRWSTAQLTGRRARFST